MSKITAIIITKNEEAMLADCMDSVSFCDEIVVVDSASTDNTAEIAKHFGAKVFVVDDAIFSQAKRRNFGRDKAKSKWLLYIDADERVTSSLKVSIQSIIEQRKLDTDAYRVERKNFYFGNHEWPVTEHLERLFQKEKLIEWTGELHESARVEGKVGDLDGYLNHYTHRDLNSMLTKTIQWSDVEAKLRFDSHHPPMAWWRFPRVMLTSFWDSYIHQKGYKVGVVGILESTFQAYSMFITYAKLWELQQKDQIRSKD